MNIFYTLFETKILSVIVVVIMPSQFYYMLQHIWYGNPCVIFSHIYPQTDVSKLQSEGHRVEPKNPNTFF